MLSLYQNLDEQDVVDCILGKVYYFSIGLGEHLGDLEITE